jgi:hypothetical protein
MSKLRTVILLVGPLAAALNRCGILQRSAIAVIGDNGRIRLEGLCWGYSGEGPRGLQILFDLLGIDENATTVAESPSNQQTKVYWSIDVEKQSVED